MASTSSSKESAGHKILVLMHDAENQLHNVRNQSRSIMSGGGQPYRELEQYLLGRVLAFEAAYAVAVGS